MGSFVRICHLAGGGSPQGQVTRRQVEGVDTAVKNDPAAEGGYAVEPGDYIWCLLCYSPYHTSLFPSMEV